jgi:hypothetical protein
MFVGSMFILVGQRYEIKWRKEVAKNKNLQKSYKNMPSDGHSCPIFEDFRPFM